MSELNFKKLDIDDREVLEDYVKAFLPFSDFSFLSLFTYNTKGTLEYCFYNDNLIVKFEDYLTGEDFYSLLGKHKIHETVKVLLETAKHNGHKYELNLVPHSVIEHAPGIHEVFEVEEDRDNFDYVVSSLDIAELRPDKFPKKHKLVENFKQKYPHLAVKPIDLSKDKNQKAILELTKQWSIISNKSADDIKTEFIAIKRLLEHAHHFPNLYALGIYDGQQLVAFNTYEISTHSHGISSFQKADKKYEGIYAYLTHEMAKSMVELGCKYINFEQDFGFEGLRASKKSWHPVNFLKKYTVKPK